MLTENNVIEAMTAFLRHQGYEILQEKNTAERGTDIIAREGKHGSLLYIEAKGETSSKGTSKRYGKPFSRNQVASHISRALLTSLKFVSENIISNSDRKRIGIALPDEKNHIDLIENIYPALRQLNVEMFWVSEIKHGQYRVVTR